LYGGIKQPKNAKKQLLQIQLTKSSVLTCFRIYYRLKLQNLSKRTPLSTFKALMNEWNNAILTCIEIPPDSVRFFQENARALRFLRYRCLLLDQERKLAP
jgi:hypothetical protein